MSSPARAGSVLVAAGILLSRLAGLLRETVASRVLGNTGVADALVVALRIPNLLQNLLGEGVLSASFVPVYSELLEGDRREADRVAGAVGALLAIVTAAAVLVLVFAARPITAVLAFGLDGERFDLAVEFTRIIAIGLGFMVMSAWCLGILNSHRRFFLPYVAPVIWNVAQIVVLLTAWLRDWPLESAARGVAIALAVGGLLQLLVQLPAVIDLCRGLNFSVDLHNPFVRSVGRRFAPAVTGRGVVQLSAYLDLVLASFLAAGGLSALFRAQILYTLPISLFAMSVAAAELPELSRLRNEPGAVVARTDAALRRIAFWMLASALLLVAAGEPLVALLFQGGEFSSADTSLVWLILIFYSFGLPAIGLSRMLQNACYAMGDTKGPARIAAIRVAIAAAAGLMLMFPLDRALIGVGGIANFGDAFTIAGPLASDLRADDSVVRLGAVGLAIGSALGAWVELLLLSVQANRWLPSLPDPLHTLRAPALAAAIAFAITALLKVFTAGLPVLVSAPLIIGLGAATYTVIAFRTGVREADMVLRPIRRVVWR